MNEDYEELLDCILSVDETLSEVEELLEKKSYIRALQKLKEARSEIEDLRDDDESSNDRQSVEMDVMKKLK